MFAQGMEARVTLHGRFFATTIQQTRGFIVGQKPLPHSTSEVSCHKSLPDWAQFAKQFHRQGRLSSCSSPFCPAGDGLALDPYRAGLCSFFSLFFHKVHFTSDLQAMKRSV